MELSTALLYFFAFACISISSGKLRDEDDWLSQKGIRYLTYPRSWRNIHNKVNLFSLGLLIQYAFYRCFTCVALIFFSFQPFIGTHEFIGTKSRFERPRPMKDHLIRNNLKKFGLKQVIPKILTPEEPALVESALVEPAILSRPAPYSLLPSSLAPSNPAPSNPTPSNPAPSNPAPPNPAPSNPAPSNPAPPNPAPPNPAPPNPAPSSPAPSSPAPSSPAPSSPAVSGPAPPGLALPGPLLSVSAPLGPVPLGPISPGPPSPAPSDLSPTSSSKSVITGPSSTVLRKCCPTYCQPNPIVVELILSLFDEVSYLAKIVSSRRTDPFSLHPLDLDYQISLLFDEVYRHKDVHSHYKKKRRRNRLHELVPILNPIR